VNLNLAAVLGSSAAILAGLAVLAWVALTVWSDCRTQAAPEHAPPPAAPSPPPPPPTPALGFSIREAAREGSLTGEVAGMAVGGWNEAPRAVTEWGVR
jgi:hypothetical protein